ncbi:aminoacyl-tRNA hydrolase [Candidatus Kaiserbacteria bacterium]|nr:aminoacyl-tRNA hydrolase [Candidatus Kaiserbacteria bacterium]
MAWIIVGLGNPGEEYDHTRHNTGRMAVQHFAKSTESSAWREDSKAKAQVTKGSLGKNLFALILPDTFMNKSGSALLKYVKSVKAAERMIVVYDDLDLPLGKIKISFDRGSGGHKGIESIARAVKTKRFVRIRVGVSPTTPSGKLRKPEGDADVEKFILGYFKDAEMDVLKKVFKETGDAIATIMEGGYAIAMNRFN